MTIALAFYVLLLVLVAVYKLRHYTLLYRYLHYRKQKWFIPKIVVDEDVDWPVVTIQLPVYNEGPVAVACLRAICRMYYPPNKLHIQVLDDSNDNTGTDLRAFVYELTQGGTDVEYINRSVRTGYKSGALANGLLTAKGEYVGMFDADFLPDPSWLKQVVTCFLKGKKIFKVDKPIGMVQTSWSYYNSDRSVVTRGARSLMDAMFKVRKFVKSFEHRAISFNGSSGLFYKECLLDVGGWDTGAVVEDTDLSFRIQRNGKYSTVFASNIICEAILPEGIREFRQQQFRWTYGTHVSLLKEILAMIKSRKILKWIEAVFTIINWSTINIANVVLIFVGALFMLQDRHYLISFVSLLLGIPYGVDWGLYFVASKTERSGDYALRHSLVVPLLGAATILHNSLAVIMATFDLPIGFMRLSRATLLRKREKSFVLEEWATSFLPGMLLLNVAYITFYSILHSAHSSIFEYLSFLLCTLHGVLYSCAFFMLKE